MAQSSQGNSLVPPQYGSKLKPKPLVPTLPKPSVGRTTGKKGK